MITINYLIDKTYFSSDGLFEKTDIRNHILTYYITGPLHFIIHPYSICDLEYKNEDIPVNMVYGDFL